MYLTLLLPLLITNPTLNPLTIYDSVPSVLPSDDVRVNYSGS